MMINELIINERRRRKKMTIYAILCMLPLIILASVVIIPSILSSLSSIGLTTVINLLIAIGTVILCVIGFIILPPT